MWAAEGGHFDIIKHLLRKGASVNNKDDFYDTALSFACMQQRHKTAKILLMLGADAHVVAKVL